jgi:predicted nucleic acid-binding protein
MRYLLISNIVKPMPSEWLLAWMGEQRDENLFIASLTIAEMRRGILEKPRGKKRDSLDAWFAGPEGPQALFSGRILSFDDKAGLLWARLMAEGKLAGRPRSGLDMIIAAVAGANDCVVVTDNENENDFMGLQIINPLRRGLEGEDRTMTAAPSAPIEYQLVGMTEDGNAGDPLASNIHVNAMAEVDCAHNCRISLDDPARAVE